MVMCADPCPNGYARDANGCGTCTCELTEDLTTSDTTDIDLGKNSQSLISWYCLMHGLYLIMIILVSEHFSDSKVSVWFILYTPVCFRPCGFFSYLKLVYLDSCYNYDCFVIVFTTHII